MDGQMSSGIFTDVTMIPDALRALRQQSPPESGVLSVYLDTSVEQVQNRAYHLAFRAGWKALRDEIDLTDRAEEKAFAAAVDRVDEYLLHTFVPRHPGLAVFASDRPDYFFAVPLPHQPQPEYAWAPEPHVSQLQEALDEFERLAVALVDKRSARLFTVYLGEIQTRESFETELPGKGGAADWPFRVRSSPPRHRGNVPGALPTGAWGGMVQGRLERRHEELVLQHVRRTSRALMDLLRREPFDRLVLAGPEEARLYLEQDLPRPLRARLAGHLSLPVTASEPEILQAALAKAEEIERQEELAMVTELIDAAYTPRVVLGLDATLEAASADRLHHLLLANDFAASGSECETCGRLVVGFDRCPTCGAPPTKAVDLRERLLARALEQGADVEIVAGEAAGRLGEHQGVGAFLRF